MGRRLTGDSVGGSEIAKSSKGRGSSGNRKWTNDIDDQQGSEGVEKSSRGVNERGRVRTAF
jgi:hypothetical protein